MSNPLMIFEEPDLEFRFGQKLKDPHDGLALFGPYDANPHIQVPRVCEKSHRC
jgi:hypothetical protein